MLPEIKAYIARGRLKRGVELVKLANRIESLKMQEDEEEDVPQEADMPADPKKAAQEAWDYQHPSHGSSLAPPDDPTVRRKRSLSKMAKSAIFREVRTACRLDGFGMRN